MRRSGIVPIIVGAVIVACGVAGYRVLQSMGIDVPEVEQPAAEVRGKPTAEPGPAGPIGVTGTTRDPGREPGSARGAASRPGEPSGGPAGSTFDAIGGRGDGDGGRDTGARGEDEPFVAQPGSMAERGAAMGIDTSMEGDWTLAGEAAEWFEPLQLAFEDARPLTPERFREVISDHTDTATDVLKRSAEIGEELGPEQGIAFLDAYNERVDWFKKEAYGSP